MSQSEEQQEDYEDLRMLREAKAEANGQPTLTLQQVKDELDD
ncbi:MAG: hypothetical protein WD425_05510 [Nitrospirales bacterium]